MQIINLFLLCSFIVRLELIKDGLHFSYTLILRKYIEKLFGHSLDFVATKVTCISLHIKTFHVQYFRKPINVVFLGSVKNRSSSRLGFNKAPITVSSVLVEIIRIGNEPPRAHFCKQIATCKGKNMIGIFHFSCPFILFIKRFWKSSIKLSRRSIISRYTSAL